MLPGANQTGRRYALTPARAKQIRVLGVETCLRFACAVFVVIVNLIVHVIERRASAVDYVNDDVNDGDPLARQGEGLCAYGSYLAKGFAMMVRRRFPSGARAARPRKSDCARTMRGASGLLSASRPARPPTARPRAGEIRQGAAAKRPPSHSETSEKAYALSAKGSTTCCRCGSSSFSSSSSEPSRLQSEDEDEDELRRSRPFFTASSAGKRRLLRDVHREGICDVGHRWLLRRSAGFQPRGAPDVQWDPRGARCPLSDAAAQPPLFRSEVCEKA